MVLSSAPLFPWLLFCVSFSAQAPSFRTLGSCRAFHFLFIFSRPSSGCSLLLRSRLRAFSRPRRLLLLSSFRGYAGAGVWVCLIFPRRRARSGAVAGVCVGVVGHLHGPALLFGGACFRDPGLASVCVCENSRKCENQKSIRTSTAFWKWDKKRNTVRSFPQSLLPPTLGSECLLRPECAA